MGVLNDPVSDNCGHLYCKTCIINWIKKNNKCPYSKNNLSIQNLRPVLAVKNLLNELKVKCKNCNHIMKCLEWKTHIINCEI